MAGVAGVAGEAGKAWDNGGRLRGGTERGRLKG